MQAALALTIVFGNQGHHSSSAHKPEIAYIQLEREGCEGTCPMYKVILRPDGSVRYYGTLFVTHIGGWTGSYWRQDFANLQGALGARGFAAMKDGKEFIVDAPVADITVGYADGTSKTVRECEEGESQKHWELASMIDGVVSHVIDWHASKSTPKKSK